MAAYSMFFPLHPLLLYYDFVAFRPFTGNVGTFRVNGTNWLLSLNCFSDGKSAREKRVYTTRKYVLF